MLLLCWYFIVHWYYCCLFCYMIYYMIYRHPLDLRLLISLYITWWYYFHYYFMTYCLITFHFHAITLIIFISHISLQASPRHFDISITDYATFHSFFAFDIHFFAITSEFLFDFRWYFLISFISSHISISCFLISHFSLLISFHY